MVDAMDTSESQQKPKKEHSSKGTQTNTHQKELLGTLTSKGTQSHHGTLILSHLLL